MSERSGSSSSPIEHAQASSEWFADVMYGYRDDIDRSISMLAKRRLGECFGDTRQFSGSVQRLRDLFMSQDYDGQCALAMYFSGYPQDALDALLPNPEVLPELIAQLSIVTNEDSSLEEDTRVSTIECDVQTGARGDRQAAVGTAQFHRIIGGDDRKDWGQDALCAQTDPEIFYPEKGGSTKLAKQVCAKCIVRDECRDYALDMNERYGIWGGLSERERRQLAKSHAKEVA